MKKYTFYIKFVICVTMSLLLLFLSGSISQNFVLITTKAIFIDIAHIDKSSHALNIFKNVETLKLKSLRTTALR